jgi:hypothetical protein
VLLLGHHRMGFLQLVGAWLPDRRREPLTPTGGCRSGGAAAVSYGREFR